MKNLREDIKNKSFKRVYLLSGDEDFLKRSYKNSLKKAIANDDMNFSYYEGKNIDVKAVIDKANTVPFISEKRCVIVENSLWFKSSVDEKLIEFMSRVPESTVLIFVETDIDKKTRLYKKIKEIGCVVELNKPSYEDLKMWCLGLIIKEKKNITETNMDLLLSYAGQSMENLKNELDKLLAYIGDKEVIDRSDIDSIVTVNAENKIFDMIRFIIAKQTNKAMELYKDLLIMREPAMRILALISRQFSQLFQVKGLMLEGLTKKQIASLLGISEYASSQIIGRCNSFDKKSLKIYVLHCLELEQAVKMGELNESLAVELLIMGE